MKSTPVAYVQTNGIHGTTEDRTSTKSDIRSALANMVIPPLLSRCRDVLSRFVVDDRHSGNCPLPRHRLVEVSFLLRELRTLELPDSDDTKHPHKRRHLLELYSIFCECIMSSERELKDLLKEIFLVVGNEFLNIES